MAEESSKLNISKQKINTLREIVYDNLDLAIKRGGDLEKLEEKSENLKLESLKFQKGTTKVKRKMCQHEWCMRFWIVAGILLLILILSMIIYAAIKSK